MDDLHAEFEKTKVNKRKLAAFHQTLGTLKFLDPACGCGNFLIITYRELRLLELEVLKVLYGKQQVTSIEHIMHIDVDQFYGIEYDEFPAKIAEVALWLMDHQMNMLVSEEFGLYYARLPLKKAAAIKHGNALQIDWQDVIPKDELSYILGNPPFYGYSLQTKQQKNDMKLVFQDVKGAGVLDYVSCWYVLAAQYMQDTNIKAAFVSTNSISQGEQVGILWGELFSKYHTKIHFAHRTFSWSNEAKGNAAVHVVIIGFAAFDSKQKYIFEYEDIKGEPHVINAKNINSYLIDSSDILIYRRNKPLCLVPDMVKGSSPTDGGHLLLTNDEKEVLIKNEPKAEAYIKPYMGSQEFINNIQRWCLWLKSIPPQTLKEMPIVINKLNQVKEMRLNSKKKSTQKWADYPSLFIEERQPLGSYVIIPRVSSERRRYVPFGFLDESTIVSDSAIALPEATLFLFGVLTSMMHMIWIRYTCGRLKNDFRYSNTLVYNNYPWPKDPSDKNTTAVESKAQHVLDVRAEFPDSSLADLYDPLTMPPKLVKAHAALDKAVDLCYRHKLLRMSASVLNIYLICINNTPSLYFLPIRRSESRKWFPGG
ncbi:MAG: class I SAM-dependent DNA methyltransferase [Mariprofundaceae bacterium]|nr:class I SAM-dependent DNA methyltransferase [Mariprofundaceae bacterium]